MHDIGARGDNKGITFTDLAAADGQDPMSVAVYWETPASAAGVDAVFKKGTITAAGWGIIARAGALWRWEAGGATATAADTAPLVSTQYGMVAAYDGVTIDYFLDGVADGTPAFTTDPTANTNPVGVGYDGVSAGGRDQSAGGFVGQPAVWDVHIGGAGATKYQGKVELPNFGNVRFWARGKVKLDDAEIPEGTAATEQGTVAMHADAAVDDAFPIEEPGMAYLVAEYWLPLIAGAKLLGSDLMCQSDVELAKMWAYLQRRIHCQVPDMTRSELATILGWMKRRSYA